MVWIISFSWWFPKASVRADLLIPGQTEWHPNNGPSSHSLTTQNRRFLFLPVIRPIRLWRQVKYPGTFSFHKGKGKKLTWFSCLNARHFLVSDNKTSTIPSHCYVLGALPMLCLEILTTCISSKVLLSSCVRLSRLSFRGLECLTQGHVLSKWMVVCQVRTQAPVGLTLCAHYITAFFSSHLRKRQLSSFPAFSGKHGLTSSTQLSYRRHWGLNIPSQLWPKGHCLYWPCMALKRATKSLGVSHAFLGRS